MSSPDIAIAHAASAGTPAKSESAPENPSSQLGQNEFLKLMIAQLQAQNPLQPANTNEYVSELAQFTQMEQTTNLATASELSGAVQLIGHTVTYKNGTDELVKGVVKSVQSGMPPTITVEGVSEIKIASVVEVN